MIGITLLQKEVLILVGKHSGWYRAKSSGERVTLASLYRKGVLVRQAWRGNEGEANSAYEYKIVETRLMSNVIRALAKVSYASNFTREEAITRLSPLGDAKAVVDEVYGARQELVMREALAAVGVVEGTLARGEGVDVDGRGLNQADRAALAALRALGEA